MSEPSRCTVLIADDDAELRNVLAELLEVAGFRVLQAADGQQALEMVLAHQPLVMLLDQRMPHLTGDQVFVRMRERGSATKVVMITAAAEGERLARELAVDGFLKKPFGMDACISAVSTLCVVGHARDRDAASG